MATPKRTDIGYLTGWFMVGTGRSGPLHHSDARKLAVKHLRENGLDVPSKALISSTSGSNSTINRKVGVDEMALESLAEVDRGEYRKGRANSGKISYHNGDVVAKVLEGLPLDSVHMIAKKCLKESTADRYGHLNEGMQRMNVGNRLRKFVNADRENVTVLEEIAAPYREKAEKAAEKAAAKPKAKAKSTTKAKAKAKKK